MSFPRLLVAALSGGFILLGSAQAQTPPREKPPATEKSAPKGKAPAQELRTCKLRLAWWTAPENYPELALQMDKNRTPISPDIMGLSQVIEYRGEPNAVLLKRTVMPEVDKAGKPIIAWIPYCTVQIGETNTDLAVLLFPDPKRNIAQTRVFDFSEEAFPYGTIQLINFTTAKIAISIDGKTAVANSRGSARLNSSYTKRSICSFKMAVAETSGAQKIIRSSTIILNPESRTLFFALELPGVNDDSRYHTELIIDNMGPKPAPKTDLEPSPKGKAAGESGGKKSSKTTPPPSQPI